MCVYVCCCCRNVTDPANIASEGNNKEEEAQQVEEPGFGSPRRTSRRKKPKIGGEEKEDLKKNDDKRKKGEGLIDTKAPTTGRTEKGKRRTSTRTPPQEHVAVHDEGEAKTKGKQRDMQERENRQDKLRNQLAAAKQTAKQDDDREEDRLRAELKEVQELVKKQNKIDDLKKKLIETRRLLTAREGANTDKENRGGGSEEHSTGKNSAAVGSHDTASEEFNGWVLDGGADKRHNILRIKATVEKERKEKLRVRNMRGAKEERRKGRWAIEDREQSAFIGLLGGSQREACLCDACGAEKVRGRSCQECSGSDEDQQVSSESDEGHHTVKGAPRTIVQNCAFTHFV